MAPQRHDLRHRTEPPATPASILAFQGEGGFGLFRWHEERAARRTCSLPLKGGSARAQYGPPGPWRSCGGRDGLGRRNCGRGGRGRSNSGRGRRKRSKSGCRPGGMHRPSTRCQPGRHSTTSGTQCLSTRCWRGGQRISSWSGMQRRPTGCQPGRHWISICLQLPGVPTKGGRQRQFGCVPTLSKGHGSCSGLRMQFPGVPTRGGRQWQSGGVPTLSGGQPRVQ